MKHFLFPLLLLLVNELSAQDSMRIFVEAGKNFSEVLTPDKIYRYPSFSNGKVFFRDGSFSESKLNYNFFNGEIEFIDTNGDTLAIADEQIPDIKEVYIDSNSFFYSNGYLEQLTQENIFGKLLKRQNFVVMETGKIGGYDMPSSSNAIQTYSGFIANSRSSVVSKLKAKQNVTLVLITEYFIGDKYNRFLPANKKNMLKLFPSKKDKINAYLKLHPVDFRNGIELKKLFQYL